MGWCDGLPFQFHILIYSLGWLHSTSSPTVLLLKTTMAIDINPSTELFIIIVIPRDVAMYCWEHSRLHPLEPFSPY